VLRVQLGLLLQVADLDARLRPRLALKSLSTPAMIRSTVDLPAPFRPSRPILAPGKNDSEMSLMICFFGGTVLLTPFMV
jgi:hypothetical protein